MMKKCSKCGEIKPIDNFHDDKRIKDGKQSACKQCAKKVMREYYNNRGGREKQGKTSMYENKSCKQYLGIVVAERLIKHLFNDVVMMPHGFPGYDMICNKGKKINVKASTINVRENKKSWKFAIKYNKSCDFFLCMAFDNVEDLNPLIAWMIPGSEVNNNSSLRISASTIHKWDKFKIDMTDAQICCNIMKGDDS